MYQCDTCNVVNAHPVATLAVHVALEHPEVKRCALLPNASVHLYGRTRNRPCDGPTPTGQLCAKCAAVSR
jgi:hypothetical protein